MRLKLRWLWRVNMQLQHRDAGLRILYCQCSGSESDSACAMKVTVPAWVPLRSRRCQPECAAGSLPLGSLALPLPVLQVQVVAFNVTGTATGIA